MELWKCILISFFGIVNGQELEPPSLLECCKDGRDRASGTQECTTLPLISSSHICRIAQEQCCAALVGEILCNNGINMARMKGACERPFFEGDPWESKTSKMCCDCCVLGLMAAGRGLNCDLGLSLGRQCAHVTQTCCTNSTEAGMLTVTQDPVVNMTSLTITEKTQVDACKDSKCSHLCVGIGTCACPPGYKLKEDELNCEDINECLNRLHNCITGQTCINTEGSFRCQRDVSCGTGYELTDNNSCQDIDECAFGTHNCVEGFVCANTPGSFRCYPKDTCGDGYIQDAIGSCIDVNECVTKTSPCLPAQTCINTVGSYTCRRNTVTCGRGYHLNQDGTRCEDVDECRGAEPCVGHGCVNLLGSYRCECKPGFIFNSITKLCEDINECRHYPGRLCAHKCENTEGSYKCSCTKGFKLAFDGRNCDDVNECDANPCSQECSNVYGSYQCYCRRGYQLSDIDGITCEDIDECALPTGGHVCSYRCSNAPGSFFCICPPTGYTLALNGRTCQDIDECAAGSHTCTVTESCFNVQGGFRCLSFECPPMFRRSTEGSSNDGTVHMRCVKDCLRGDIGCLVRPSHLFSQTVLSLPTFREFSHPEEIVFLRTMAQASPASSLGASDVVFKIVATDDQNSFDVVKRFDHDIIMGVVRQVKPITGPKDIVLKVDMNYEKSGTISHSNTVVIHIFVSEFWF